MLFPVSLTLSSISSREEDNVLTDHVLSGPVETLDAQILTEGLTLCEAFTAPKATLGHRLDRANERFVPGTPPYLLKNATIWVGAADASGGVVHGDVLLRDGLIEQVGHIEKEALEGLKGVQTIDLGGKWVTPGVVDMHSHSENFPILLSNLEALRR